MRVVLIATLAALLVADVWTANTAFNAVFHEQCEPAECDGAVYWAAVALILLIFVGLGWATWRVWLRVRTNPRHN